MMVLTLPTRKRVVIPLDELTGITAAPPRHLPGVPERISSVVISTLGRRLRLLPYRDYVEMVWFARQLREAVERAKHGSNGPDEALAADMQKGAEPRIRWSGPLPAPPDASERARHRLRKTFGRFLDYEYNRLGCGTGLFLLLLAISGLWIFTREIAIGMICLQFGSDAYFHHGLRTAPHRGFFIPNNGQRIAPQYEALAMALYFVWMPIWVTAALLIAIAINRILLAISERRWRARRARRNKGEVGHGTGKSR